MPAPTTSSRPTSAVRTATWVDLTALRRLPAAVALVNAVTRLGSVQHLDDRALRDGPNG